MALFKSKEERMRAKEIAREKRAHFEGKALQRIGQIPKSADVKITLKPEDRVLNIRHKKIDVTLPYDRLVAFNLKSSVSDMHSEKKELAKDVLTSGLLGRGTVGAAGKLVGKYIVPNLPHTNQMTTNAELVYVDKTGVQQSLWFERDKEFEHNAFDDSEDKDTVAEDFEDVISMIVARNQGTDMNEL